MKIEHKDELFNEEELKNTPLRVQGFFSEWERNQNFKFTKFDNPGYDQMIILKDIDFHSMCSHHLLVFHGKCHLGYVPKDKICGVSKLARTVDKFASRPQIQERLTHDILNYLREQLEPKGVMVIIEAVHECMRMRGVKKPNSVMITSAFSGVFEQKETREEFLRLTK